MQNCLNSIPIKIFQLFCIQYQYIWQFHAKQKGTTCSFSKYTVILTAEPLASGSLVFLPHRWWIHLSQTCSLSQLHSEFEAKSDSISSFLSLHPQFWPYLIILNQPNCWLWKWISKCPSLLLCHHHRKALILCLILC